MAGLTEAQQNFLNNYIREHPILGKKKSSDALKFAQRRDKILSELSKLPNFNSIRKDLMARLLEADKSADEGEFRTAHRKLDKIKSEAIKAAKAYDPSADTAQLGRQILAFMKNAQDAVPQMVDLEKWRQAKKSDPAPPTDKPGKFFETANRLVETFHQRLGELVRVARSPKEQAVPDRMRKELWSKVTAGDFAPLRIKADTFYTPSELKTLREVHGGDVLQLFEESKKDVEMKKNTVDKIRKLREPLKTVDSKELLLGINDEMNVNVEGIRKISQDYKKLPDYDRVKNATQKSFSELLDKQLATDGEEKLFSLLTKTHDEYVAEFCKAKGWPPNFDKLTPQQTALACTAADGMYAAVLEHNPGKMDSINGTIQLNNKTYGSPKVLAKGANGRVTRFENTQKKGEFITIKTNTYKDTAREKTAKESLEHYHAMKADPKTPGRKNVCGFEGLIADENGDMHMVIEYLDGGDVDKLRWAMTAAQESGVLPEECRALLNQFTMKQAVEGVIYLHEQNIFHNDLKPGNMMLTSSGELKIVDLGESVAGEDEHGKISTDKMVGTAGYDDESAIRNDNVSLKSDDYALGMSAGVLERSELDARVEFKTLDMEQMSGALGQFAKGLTDPEISKRPTLESVMQSSYLSNLKNYPEEDVKDLMKAVIEYGKLLDSDEIVKRQSQIVSLRKKMTGLELEMKKLNGDLQKKQEKLEEWKQHLRDVETLQEEIREIGSDPSLEEQLNKMREITDRLQGRTGGVRSDTEFVPGFKEFLELLHSVKTSPHEFRAVAPLRSYNEFYRIREIDPAKIRDALEYYDYDVTSGNPYARAVVLAAEKATSNLIDHLNKDAYLAEPLTTGARSVFDTIVNQFETAHKTKYEPQFLA